MYRYDDLDSYTDYIQQIKNKSLLSNNAFEIYYLYTSKRSIYIYVS